MISWGSNGKAVQKEILKMQNYYMMVAMMVNKHCAASGRALQAESAASEIQHVKIHLQQNRSKYMHERRFAVMSSLQCVGMFVFSVMWMELSRMSSISSLLLCSVGKHHNDE